MTAKKLTLAEVKQRVTKIIEDSDAETAHRIEDDLHFEFFEALAKGHIKQPRAHGSRVLAGQRHDALVRMRDPHLWPGWYIPVLCWGVAPTLAVVSVLLLLHCR